MLKVGLVIGDVAALVVAFSLAYWLRFHLGLGFERDIVPDAGTYLRVGALMVPTWMLMIAAMGGYNQNLLLGGTGEYSRVVNAATWGAMIVMIYGFFDIEFSISRGWLVLSWLLSAFVLCAFRFTARRVAYRMRRMGYFVSKALIVGANEEARALADQLSPRAHSGLQILGLVQTQQQDEGAPSATLGTLDDLPEIVRRTGATEVIVASSAVTRDELIRMATLLKGLPETRMKLSSGLYEVLTTGMEISTPNNVPLMSLNNLRLSRTEVIMKSALDYTLILMALPLLLPIFALVALLVRLDSPGPIFHRRRVMGVGAKPFDAFKFRTMAVNGDAILDRCPEKKAELEATHKIKDDPRVTRVGRMLRSLSLDELPQLINVLAGQMSLVGPRMISPEEQEKYGRMRHNLFTVKPGLTGMWQVSGRSDLSYEERVQLDMTYIRNYSIWSDIQILFFQTLPAVFRKTGAY
jgi:exopolysaccharide biosynthesis polyprenyl glycosylphosphotransferase